MANVRHVLGPASGAMAAPHDARFAVFERLQDVARDAARRGPAARA